jgi:DNA-3-methyladenine glycosylase II
MYTGPVIRPGRKEVSHLRRHDRKIAKIIDFFGPISYALCGDPFSYLVKTIIGQMLSKQAASKVQDRFLAFCGNEVTPELAAKLKAADLRQTGMSSRKAEYIVSLGRHIRENPGFFDDLSRQGDDDAIKTITRLHGLGVWSAKMYLIFVLNRPDVLPHEDGAFRQVYKWLYETDDASPRSIMRQCAPWQPYSSLAVRYMYLFLDAGGLKR